MTRSDAVRVIRQMKGRYYPRPKAYWSEKEIQRRSYERWTLDELIRELSDEAEDWLSPRLVLMDFMDLMDEQAGRKSPGTWLFYTTAYEMAKEVFRELFAPYIFGQ